MANYKGKENNEKKWVKIKRIIDSFFKWGGWIFTKFWHPIEKGLSTLSKLQNLFFIKSMMPYFYFIIPLLAAPFNLYKIIEEIRREPKKIKADWGKKRKIAALIRTFLFSTRMPLSFLALFFGVVSAFTTLVTIILAFINPPLAGTILTFALIFVTIAIGSGIIAGVNHLVEDLMDAVLEKKSAMKFASIVTFSSLTIFLSLAALGIIITTIVAPEAIPPLALGLIDIGFMFGAGVIAVRTLVKLVQAEKAKYRQEEKGVEEQPSPESKPKERYFPSREEFFKKKKKEGIKSEEKAWRVKDEVLSKSTEQDSQEEILNCLAKASTAQNVACHYRMQDRTETGGVTLNIVGEEDNIKKFKASLQGWMTEIPSTSFKQKPPDG